MKELEHFIPSPAEGLSRTGFANPSEIFLLRNFICILTVVVFKR